MELVRAAGGVVWRPGPSGPRLAVVHRPFHRDWSLPKGKLDAGESWRRAALREVAEETGCHVRIQRFAGAKLLVGREVPKLVLYWHMRLVRDGALDGDEEVDEVAWLSPRQALSRLDGGSDRRLLLRALSDGWWRGGRAERGAPRRGREPLRRLLVLDRDRTDEALAPFLRLIAATVTRGRSSAGRGVGRS